MPSQLTCLKVFIASPGGLEEERKAFREELKDYNEMDAIDRGYYFQALGWEDTLSSVGRPQMLINEDVRKADYMFLILWNRWGSRPDDGSSGFTSGTEEEYQIALECYEKGDMHKIVMMFKAVDTAQLNDPGEQLKKVLNFRNKIEQEKTHLFHSFDTIENFRKYIRKCLASWIREQERGVTEEPVSPMIEKYLFDTISGTKGYPSTGPSETKRYPLIGALDSASIKNAWDLANAGKLTDAEIEFAKLIVGRREPTPFIEYGLFLTRLGRLDQAKIMLKKAEDIATDQNLLPTIATISNYIGDILITQGDLHGAQQIFQKALEINEMLECQKGMATAYTGLGNILRIQGNLDDAEQMFRESLKINEAIGNMDGLADDYGNLGYILLIRGNWDDAEQMCQDSLEINEKIGRAKGVALAYGNLGVIMRIRGDLDGAEQMHQDSLEISEKLGYLEGMTLAYTNLGAVMRERGDLDGAEGMFQSSLEINEMLECREGMAADYGNLGIILHDRGDLDGAEQMYREALEINELLGNQEGMAADYTDLGIILQDRGDWEGAEEMFREVLEINERLGHPEGMTRTYGNLATVMQKRGDSDGAEEMYHEALEIAEQLGSLPLITKINSQLNSLRNNYRNL